MDFKYTETVFYLVTLCVGTFASLARILLSTCDICFRSTVAGCLAGGCYSFGVVAVLLRYDTGGVTNPWFYLGVAALIGLGGREQEKLSRILLAKVFSVFGIQDDEPKNKTDTE